MLKHIKRLYKLNREAMMSKVRIVKRTHADGRIDFVIQQKHFLFRWWWVDAWINSSAGAACQDYFGTLDEAERNLCYFDGSTSKDEIVK